MDRRRSERRRGGERRAHERKGRWAEAAAAWWLRLHGWRIVGRRVPCRPVEVDLLAVRGGVLAFVEVKYRRTMDEALRALTAPAVARLLAAAEGHGPALARKYHARNIRCDLIAIADFSLPKHLAGLR